MSLELLPCDVRQICRDVVRLLSAKASQKELELLLDYPAECPRYVLADAGGSDRYCLIWYPMQSSLLQQDISS